MKLICAFLFTLFFVSIQSDTASEILSEFQINLEKFTSNIENAKNTTIAAYLEKAIEYTEGNEYLKSALIDRLKKLPGLFQSAGQYLEKIYNDNQLVLTSTFNYETLYNILDEDFQSILNYLLQQLTSGLDNFIAGTSDADTLLSCWNANREEINAILQKYSTAVNNVLTTEQTNIFNSLEGVNSQRMKFFKELINQELKLRKNAKSFRNYFASEASLKSIINQFRNTTQSAFSAFEKALSTAIKNLAEEGTATLEEIQNVVEKLQNCIAVTV